VPQQFPLTKSIGSIKQIAGTFLSDYGK